MAGTRWRDVLAGLMLGGLLAAPAAWAVTEAITGQPTYLEGSMRKLGRGIANIFTCPAELIRTAEPIKIREGYLAAASVGLVKGLARTVQRAAVGVFEVLTFYAEVPEGFKPIMKPEFVFAHGDWVEE